MLRKDERPIVWSQISKPSIAWRILIWVVQRKDEGPCSDFDQRSLEAHVYNYFLFLLLSKNGIDKFICLLQSWYMYRNDWPPTHPPPSFAEAKRISQFLLMAASLQASWKDCSSSMLLWKIHIPFYLMRMFDWCLQGAYTCVTCVCGFCCMNKCCVDIVSHKII